MFFRNTYSENKIFELIKVNALKTIFLFRFPIKSEKPDFMHKEKSNYTIKYENMDDFHDEDLPDSDDSYSETPSDTFSNYNKKIDCAEQSNFDDIHLKEENNESPLTLQRRSESESSIYSESRVSTPKFNLDVYQVKKEKENVENKYTSPPRQTQMLPILTNENVKNESTQSPRQTQMLSVLTNGNIKNKSKQSPIQTSSPQLSVLTVVKRDIRSISPTLDMREPRFALRKLEKELDKLELEKFIKTNENVEDENNDVVIVNDIKLEGQTKKDDTVELIELDEDENHVEETEVEAAEHSKINNYIKKEAEDLTTAESFAKKEAQKENDENLSDNDKSSKKKNKKCKKGKKNESHKSKHKKCVIM